MPALTNPKHELFAQELAKGRTQIEAHEAAGYKPHRGNASALAQDKNILERVSEIQSERAEMDRQATEKAAEALSIDKKWVMSRLIENATRAAASEDYSPSNKALELLGKELGMFIDRSLNENVNTNYVIAGDPIESIDDWEAQFAPKH